jgi:hypothetical protein
MVTPVALRDMVNAVRKFRRLPEIRRRDGFKLSFNTQTFIPGCINLGNQSSIWEWDVLAGQFDFAVDGLPLPPDSVDEFVTEGFVHRLAAKQFEGFATSVYACLKPNAVFKGSFNLLDEAKRRMLEASQMADPQFAEQCLVTEMLSVASFKATVEHLGFAVNLLERGGKYNSVEDINLPEMNPALQGGALCCMVGCPSARFKPQTSDVPSKYCRRHYTTAARILWHDIAQRAIVMFSVSKRFRFRKGRRVRL